MESGSSTPERAARLVSRPRVAWIAGSAAAVVVTVAVVAAWPRGDAAEPSASAEAATATATAEPSRAAVMPEDPATAIYTVLTLAGTSLPVLDAPGGQLVETLGEWSTQGSPTTVLAVDTAEADGGTWYEVQLPARPGHEMGWVNAADVTATPTTVRIDVFLADHTLVLSDGAAVLLTTTVAVGAPASPTPLGLFYVTDPFDYSHNPTGVYGAAALGLSGYSEVLTSFDGAAPQIAIHGTNQPELLGQEVSNGCIRLTNEAVTALTGMAGPGTPVVVHASRSDEQPGT